MKNSLNTNRKLYQGLKNIRFKNYEKSHTIQYLYESI